MPWYVWVYVVLLVGIGVYSFVDDMNEMPRWYVATDAAISVVWILAVAAWYYPRLAPPPQLGVPVLVVAILWTAWDARRELRGVIARRPEAFDPELSARANLWVDRAVEIAGVVIGTLLLTPAIVCAVRVLERSFT